MMIIMDTQQQKKEAQREAVYDFLRYLMDIEDDYE